MVKLNNLKIEPLEFAFGGKNIEKIKVAGDIKQSLCADFRIPVATVTSTPLELPAVKSCYLDTCMRLKEQD